MVWHILKKDLRLLWPLALIVGALQGASAALRVWVDVHSEIAQLADIAPMLTVLTLVGMVVLTISAMHQDAVPGGHQDWLVRPIPRRDLIIAKLLFVLLLVQAPALLADLCNGLAHGFGFGTSFEAALARNVALLCLINLPAVMLGAVTRSLTESLVMALAGLAAYVAIFAVGALILLRIRSSLGGTGLVWITPATWYVLALVGAPVVVSAQYLRRRTTAIRWLVFAGGAVVFLSAFLPWSLAVAIQETLAPQRGAASGVNLAFDPQFGTFKSPAGAAAAAGTVMYLPLRITGIPSSGVVVLDRAQLDIRDGSGELIYRGRSNLSVDGFGSIEDAQFEARQASENRAPVALHQRIFLPRPALAKLANRTVELDIDYTLTLFRPQAAYSLAALNGRAMLGTLGSCATQIDAEGDDVRLRCTSARSAPSCFTAYLENRAAGLRNPEVHRCEPNYSPIDGRFWPDSLARMSGELPFFDRAGLTHYPIDGSKLADSRFVIRTYVPQDHFVRHLQIRELRLADFLGQATAGEVQR